jgi:Ser/Thr protein kinase RdoA (MazF antagonist)
VNAKLYRGKNGSKGPQELAEREAQNLQFAHQTSESRNLEGMPRPIGDFAGLGAVVSTKVNGLPLQSIIMKAALLPADGSHHLLEIAAQQAGAWLQQFHKATAGISAVIDVDAHVAEFEKLCGKASKDGLPADSIEAILANAKGALSRHKKPLRSSALLQDFIPLNVLVAEHGIGFCEFANLKQQGPSLQDAAMFLAAVEVLEKYPFCNRDLTSRVQDAFVEAYGVSQQEEALLDTLKMKILLQMFAQGRLIKESAERKKVMWANVMKRFIQQAARRSAARVA